MRCLVRMAVLLHRNHVQALPLTRLCRHTDQELHYPGFAAALSNHCCRASACMNSILWIQAAQELQGHIADLQCS